MNIEVHFTFHAKQETIKDQNWNEVWEKNYFKPLVVADKCVVRAPFHTDYPKAEYEIVIEPNMAFGTGNHETTSMMLEFILENDFQWEDCFRYGMRNRNTWNSCLNERGKKNHCY